MQFFYRLGVVIIGSFVLCIAGLATYFWLDGLPFPHHELTYEQIEVAIALEKPIAPFDVGGLREVAGALTPHDVVSFQTKTDKALTVILGIAAGTLAAYVVVLIWRWICGQAKPARKDASRPIIVYGDAGDGRGLQPIGTRKPDLERDHKQRSRRFNWKLWLIGFALVGLALLIADAAGFPVVASGIHGAMEGAALATPLA